MSGFRIEGNTSGNVAEVDSGNHLEVNLGKDTSLAGYGIIMSENDPGTVTGTPVLASPETSLDYRLRSSLDMVLFSESFNYTAQDSGKWQSFVTSQAITYSGGFANLNSAAVTTSGTGALLKTYRTFPILGVGPTYFETYALYTQTPMTNNVMELGCGIPAAATTALLDGIVFRWDAAGALKGVLNYNGTENQTAAFVTVPAANTLHKYTITITQKFVEFWIDDVLVGSIVTPTGFGSPASEAALPAIARTYNSGTVTGTGQILKVAEITISLGDWATYKPWAHQMAAAGNHIIQGVSGMTQGQTANYSNSAAPASATLSNTAAGYATLGGQFQFAAVAGAETDYALFAYQVPAPAVSATARQLIITEIHIDTYNTGAAVATTGTVLQWALAVGSTATSLATAEAATTKSPRRHPIGVQSFAVGAAIGAQANTLDRTFSTPMVVNSGEFVHIILKMPIGTATASQVIRGVVSINGYWE